MHTSGVELRLDWEGIEVDVMDCEANNLAVLLRHHGVDDVLSPFAIDWYLGLSTDGRLIVDRRPVGDAVLAHTGFAVESQTRSAHDVLAISTVRLHVGRASLLYADAYLLPWLPYCGTEHMEHTLLVTGVSEDTRTFTITDVYDNVTQWGPAVPLRTTVGADALQGAIAALHGPDSARLVGVEPQEEPPEPPSVAACLQANGEGIRRATDGGMLAAYTDGFRDRLDDLASVKALALDCWLASRRRELHSRWLQAPSTVQTELLPATFVDAFATDLVPAWQQASSYAYVAQRRVERQRRAPTAVLDLLATEVQEIEARLADQLLDHLAAAPARGGA